MHRSAGMDDDGAFQPDHGALLHLTTILGNAQMLRRRITRAPDLSSQEQERLLHEIAAIERAARELQREQERRSPPDE